MRRGVIVRAVLVIGLVMVVMAFLVSLAIVQYGPDHGAGPIVADAFAFPVALGVWVYIWRRLGPAYDPGYARTVTPADRRLVYGVMACTVVLAASALMIPSSWQTVVEMAGTLGVIAFGVVVYSQRTQGP